MEKLITDSSLLTSFGENVKHLFDFLFWKLFFLKISKSEYLFEIVPIVWRLKCGQSCLSSQYLLVTVKRDVIQLFFTLFLEPARSNLTLLNFFTFKFVVFEQFTAN